MTAQTNVSLRRKMFGFQADPAPAQHWSSAASPEEAFHLSAPGQIPPSQSTEPTWVDAGAAFVPLPEQPRLTVLQ